MESQEINQPMSEAEEMEILGIEEFDRAEWVFQFDDEEPIVIAWSNSKEEPGELSFVLKANSESNLTFRSIDGSRKMQIFARRMPDERRAELDELQRIEQENIEKINQNEVNQ
jgi:hypothetical protein